ncbi:Cloroperoxidase [Mytilinidion resinicola]|uniref:Cloroperoxidase n=1 Tax=Mytilinidion resinicola TaxID=574789 RepID=A0A6A6Y555_9PEZI|nr:Cloroperoxidase [Mytilinidion resinicola]KAF2802917.1 Cloroperoxidase [Mytilinidion resinicola]
MASPRLRSRISNFLNPLLSLLFCTGSSTGIHTITLTLTLTLLLLSPLVASTTLPDFLNWHSPLPGDLRGPCPGLNALANHALIPHNGRNLSIPLLVDTLGSVFNLSPELARIVSFGGIALGPGNGTFSLLDLNKHNAIEHDGSLSRADYNLGGDNFSLNPAIFASYMRWFEGSGNMSLNAAAVARLSRVQTERFRDGAFVYGPSQQFNSYLESAILWLTMVDPADGGTKVEFVRTLFEEERLPYKEGWRPPKAQINGASLASTILQLALATPAQNVPWDLTDLYAAGLGRGESDEGRNGDSRAQRYFLSWHLPGADLFL